MYIGRFAPSPTGPLHFGSLVAAVASFLDARHHEGRWLLRMEDLDKPREQPGAAAAILHTLDRLALHWDGPVVYQSGRLEAYHEAIDRLVSTDHAYACACTRREVADSALQGCEGPIYPGTCRAGLAPGQHGRSVRVRVDGPTIVFDDRLQGRCTQDLSTEIGDFVALRADGIVAYQLAVVVDDAAQGVTHVVRGSDLLSSTARQIHLQRLLGYATPQYLHLPVAVNAAGKKLSKQTRAAPVDARSATASAILAFLGQTLPPAATDMRLEELWGHAARAWDPRRIPKSQTIRVHAQGRRGQPAPSAIRP